MTELDHPESGRSNSENVNRNPDTRTGIAGCALTYAIQPPPTTLSPS